MKESEYLSIRRKIGQRLRDNRVAYGISQSSIAVHSGLSTRTIGQMERGEVWWSVFSEIKYIESLKYLAEANHKRRTTSKNYVLPPILDPAQAIFLKYL
jgi:predicted transcriptional regulator